MEVLPKGIGTEAARQRMTELEREIAGLRQQEKKLFAYIRSKIDQLLGVMGTLPLQPEELDDEMLLSLDPIGILGDSFAQVLEHLQNTNEDLAVARDEIQAIFDSAGAGILVVDDRMRLKACNRLSQEIFFPERPDVLGRTCREMVCGSVLEDCIFERILATRQSTEQSDFCCADRYFHVVGTPIKDRHGDIALVVLVYTDITYRKRAEEELRKSEARYRDLFENANDLIQSVGPDGRYIYVNNAWRQALGYAPEEIAALHFSQIVHPDSLGHCRQIFGKLLAGERVGRLEATFVSRDGKAIQVEGSINCQQENGRVVATRGIFRDITARKQAEAALRESEERFRLLYDQAPMPYQSLDEDARFLEVNQAFLDLLGYAREEVVGRWAGDFMEDDSRERFRETFCRFRESGSMRGEEFTMAKKDGERIVVAINGQVGRDVGGRFKQSHCILHDITERKAADRRIRQLAFFDTLTGLPNRTLLQDRLDQALVQAGRDSQQVAVLFLDLDRFKNVNDTLGHGVGDLLLQNIAVRLRDCVRRADTVARLGGDEFVIVMAALNDIQSVTRVARKILDSLAIPVRLAGHDIYSTVSIGIAVCPGDGEEADLLLKNADTAMYKAKEQGRNTFQFYAPEMNIEALERLLLGNDLRHALERGEFLLHYQPQLCVATGRLVGMEALLRWRHPELGLIPPATFIPLVEESGIIVPLGAWLLETACARCRYWQTLGYADLKLAVNISGRQFKNRLFVDQVGTALQKTGLAPAHLEIELTEGILMENEAARTFLTGLKALGAQLAIDDFGTGYSSLNHLKQFPMDRVKIDTSFIRGIPASDDDAAIAEAIIALGHSLKLKVVAEGVENAEQLQFLRSRGCDEMQGHLFSRALPEGEIDALLRRLTPAGDCLHR